MQITKEGNMYRVDSKGLYYPIYGQTVRIALNKALGIILDLNHDCRQGEEDGCLTCAKHGY